MESRERGYAGPRHVVWDVPLPELEESHRLLCLIEQHGWSVIPAEDTLAAMKAPAGQEPDGYAVYGLGCNGHIAPTLIEALTAASRCPRCTGGE